MRQTEPSRTVMWAVHYTEGPPVGADGTGSSLCLAYYIVNPGERVLLIHTKVSAVCCDPKSSAVQASPQGVNKFGDGSMGMYCTSFSKFGYI